MRREDNRDIKTKQDGKMRENSSELGRKQRMGREDNRDIRTKQDGKMRGNSFNFRGQYIVGRTGDRDNNKDIRYIIYPQLKSTQLN